jgi:hypothetical protein
MELVSVAALAMNAVQIYPPKTVTMFIVLLDIKIKA